MIEKRARVLIVDDDVDLCDSIKHALPSSIDVQVINRSRDVMDHYTNAEGYDLVIVDYNIPDKNGEGLIFDIKLQNSWQNIIMITGAAEELKVPAVFGVRAFLKPFPIKKLLFCGLRCPLRSTCKHISTENGAVIVHESCEILSQLKI